MRSRGERYPAGVLIAYYLTLGAFFAASFYPEYRVWGISWWAYFPLWVKFGLLTVGAVAPFVADRIIDRLLAGRDDITSSTYRWLVGGFVVVMLALFYFLRARTHFLGDGYTLLSLLGSDNPFIKPRNFGGTIFQYWIFKFINGTSEADALLAYQVVSIGAGILFMSIALWSATKLVPNRLSRLFYVLSLCTSGYMLMFFGYVENYALFAVAILAFMVAIALIEQHRISKWWIVVIQGIAGFLHIFGVVLLPATIFVLLREGPIWRKFLELTLRARVVVIVAIAGLLGFLLTYAYMTSYFFRFSILPLVSNAFTVQGYTLFSLPHLTDFLNLLFILAPGGIVGTLLLGRQEGRRKPQAMRVTLCLAAAGCTGAAFAFSPGLGMPRDWDLFALMGIALSATFAILMFIPDRGQMNYRGLVLVPLLGVFLLLPRAIAVANPFVITEHVLNYIHYDPFKSSSTLFLLSKFLRESGRLEEEEAVNSLWRTVDPEGAIIAAYTVKLESSDSAHFEQVLKLAIERNPSNWSAWADLGALQYQRGEYNDALYSLHVADGLNPYNTHINYNIALCNFRLRAYEDAEKRLVASLKADTSSISNLTLLATVYRGWGRDDQAMTTIRRIAARNDAPPEYVNGWIDYLVNQGKVKEAEDYLAAKSTVLLDSNQIASLRNRASRYSRQGQGETDTIRFAGIDSAGSIPAIDKTVSLRSDSTTWDEAVRHAVAKNPTSWVAWGNLGVVYLRKDAFDSARMVLEIAVSINPINSANYSNLAFAEFYLEDFSSAEAHWFRASALDSASLYPIVGLAKLYQKTNQQDKYLQYFMRVVSRPDAPGDYLKVMGDYFLMQKKWLEAADMYARAVQNGYEARLLDSIFAQHPQLKRET